MEIIHYKGNENTTILFYQGGFSKKKIFFPKTDGISKIIRKIARFFVDRRKNIIL